MPTSVRLVWLSILEFELTRYTENRSGILAQVAPNLGPIVSIILYHYLYRLH
jgi:hypothetical protein